MKIKITYGLSNIKDAYSLRIAVFVKEQGFSMETEMDGRDEESIHAVGYTEGRPAATARAYPVENGVYRLGRVAVLKEYRKCGFGRSVITALEDELKKNNCRKLLLSAQEQAVPFYEKLGYVQTGEKYYEENWLHCSMYKEL